jgi:hypothetical protein
MRRVLAKAQKENPLNQVILQGFETLAAQNTLLVAEIEGLKETVKLQKKRAVRSKPLFEKLADEDGSRAIWFSPAKIRRARELQQEKEDQEQQERQVKEQKALEKQRAKEEKELQLQKRREEREQARLQREAQKAQKQAAVEALKAQREATKQLKLEAQNAAKNKREQACQSKARKSFSRAVAESGQAESARLRQTRAGRKTQLPQRFQNK